MKKLFIFILTWLGIVFTGNINAADQKNNPGATSFSGFNFSLLDTGNGHGESTVESDGKNGFKMTVKNTDPNNYGIAIANFHHRGTAQQKFVFRMRGAEANASANMSIDLLYKVGEKWFAASVSGFTTNHSEFKTFILSLDQDFRLSDSGYDFVQLKFGFGGNGNGKGAVSCLEVKDVRIVNADELTSTGSDLTVIPYPVAEREIIGNFPPPLKVYFEFDNDDATPYAQCRHEEPVKDNVADFSFRHLLLENTEGLIQNVSAPSDADLIIYSRATPGKAAKTIRNAVVNQGKRLIAFGQPGDLEIRELLPMELHNRSFSGLPERQSLTVKTEQHPLLKGMTLTEHTFGLYFDAKVRSGEPLITYANGAPFLVKNGAVVHVAYGIGNNLEQPESVFFDSFLLQLMFRLAGRDTAILDQRKQQVVNRKKAEEDSLVMSVASAAGIPKSEWGNWHAGMSRNNMGRFGWLIGEPLPTSVIGRDLTASNDPQSYRFVCGSGRSISIRPWNRKAVKGKVEFSSEVHRDADPTELWKGEGVVEYESQMVMDADWKGKKIYFEVKSGIDDLDTTYFNGIKIGETDIQTKEYWMTPRKYLIPDNIIHWGEKNSFRVQVTNLRGNAAFGSRPVITITEPGANATLAVSKIDWTGKTYAITEKGISREMQFSLLTPFIRYRFPTEHVFLAQENIADHAAWQTPTGIRIVPLDGKNSDFFQEKRDGKWSAPWLLLFRQGTSRPLLLVFSRQPSELKASLLGDLLEGIQISNSKEIGELCAGWIWGVQTVDTANWTKNLPVHVLNQINNSLSLALNYPDRCDEIYSIDRQKQKIAIANRFNYHRITDEWNTPVKSFATLPPLCGFMYKSGKLVQAETLVDFGITTNLGPWLGLWDRNTIAYWLPLPDGKDFLPVGVRDQEINEVQNRMFADGVLWSAGGHTPLAAWQPDKPYGTELPNHSICLFRWNFGLGTALQDSFFLTPENRDRLKYRLCRRYLEPLELYQYKSVARYREEPFSHLKYPIVMNAFFSNSTTYAQGMGSSVTYADSNEACALVVWVGRQLADMYGQGDTIKANWPFLKQVMRYQMYVDDYAFNSGSCRETGVGAWIDMLNGEFGGMLAYARLAEIAGDSDESSQAIYRAAKKTIPTLARFYFASYLENIRPEMKGKLYQISGFGEDGAKVIYFPAAAEAFAGSHDLFDFSQGMFGTLYRLYEGNVTAEIREHLEKRAWPSLQKPSDPVYSYEYLQPLSLFARDGKQVENYARKDNYSKPLQWRLAEYETSI